VARPSPKLIEAHSHTHSHSHSQNSHWQPNWTPSWPKWRRCCSSSSNATIKVAAKTELETGTDLAHPSPSTHTQIVTQSHLHTQPHTNPTLQKGRRPQSTDKLTQKQCQKFLLTHTHTYNRTAKQRKYGGIRGGIWGEEKAPYLRAKLDAVLPCCQVKGSCHALSVPNCMLHFS